MLIKTSGISKSAPKGGLAPEEVKRFVTHFGRHMVAWTVIDHPLGPDGKPVFGQPREWNGSAFLMSIRGEWILVTAGHVIKAFQDVSKEDPPRIATHSRLFDCWSPDRKFKTPLPFPLLPERSYVLGTGNDGPDIGFVYLGSVLAGSLEANNLVALDEPGWRNVPTEFDRYFVFGVPGELRGGYGERFGMPTVYDASAVMLRVDKIDDPQYTPSTHDRFFAKIIDPTGTQQGSLVKDIGGMSGGPIFGFKRVETGDLRYWPVAVQSAWYEEPRIIVGEYFTDIAVRLEAALATLLDAQS